MKVIRSLAIGLLPAFLTLLAGAQDEAPPAPKGECQLCKLPNRAALFAGTAKACPADCTKLCCTGSEVTYLVEGLVCENCTGKVTAALARLDGVSVEAVCHITGQARLRYDPAKVDEKTLVSTIVAAGHKVAGRKVSFPVAGLTAEAEARALEEALSKAAGVSRITATIGTPSSVVVVFDPARTTRAKIQASIDAAGSKVAADD